MSFTLRRVRDHLSRMSDLMYETGSTRNEERDGSSLNKNHAIAEQVTMYIC